MSFYTFAQSLWERFTWEGVRSKFGESVAPQELPSIENTVPGERTISTTVDCYVTGQYIDNKGRMFQIKQRYSVQITYSTSTWSEVMEELRRALVEEFERQYSQHDFNVTDVFIPQVAVPREAEAIEEYRGRRLWKLLTRVERRRMEIGLAREVYRARRRGIIRRYSTSRFK